MSLDEILEYHDRANAYFMLCDYYASACSDERELIRELWDFGKKWVYSNPDMLASELKNQPSPRERIKASLIYDSIENLRDVDVRDRIVGHCRKYHSCLASGIDPKTIFEEVASISSDEVASLLRSFVERTPEEQSLEAFHLKKVVDDNGIIWIVNRTRRI